MNATMLASFFNLQVDEKGNPKDFKDYDINYHIFHKLLNTGHAEKNQVDPPVNVRKKFKITNEEDMMHL